jgi:hypothetical protein
MALSSLRRAFRPTMLELIVIQPPSTPHFTWAPASSLLATEAEAESFGTKIHAQGRPRMVPPVVLIWLPSIQATATACDAVEDTCNCHSSRTSYKTETLDGI